MNFMVAGCRFSGNGCPLPMLLRYEGIIRMSSTPTPALSSRLRWVRPPEPHVQLKEFGLCALTALLRSLSGSNSLSDAATSRVVTRLNALLGRLPAGSLFTDFSPPAMIPEIAVVLKPSDVVADSERSSSHGGPLLSSCCTCTS